MKILRSLFLLLCFFSLSLCSQNVIIVVMDGARYSETFGSDSLYIPHIWNQLRMLGTIWTNFYNDGLTKTDPGHATIATGVWQTIDNKGNGRPEHPTVFEYFRKYTKAPMKAAAVVAGKQKLAILTYSTHPDYGTEYRASSFISSTDISVLSDVKKILSFNRPQIMMINLPSTDSAGHSGRWTKYLTAIHIADSLIWNLWQTLQSDSLYRNTTTLFVTNDHGRHDDAHGGFKSHGDSCEGCRHILCLAVGHRFQANQIIKQRRTQCDIAPTVGELLSFPTPFSIGTSLLRDVDSDKVEIQNKK
ncbi:MAG: alkaline phosphatase family protein [Ignavibacteriales bacterium]|nr:alkaline phosphatase family protein [Ignavibacteriales bacterium]